MTHPLPNALHAFSLWRSVQLSAHTKYGTPDMYMYRGSVSVIITSTTKEIFDIYYQFTAVPFFNYIYKANKNTIIMIFIY